MNVYAVYTEGGAYASTWFIFWSLSDVDGDVLPVHRYQDILHSIHLSRKVKPGLRTCHGHQELLKYLRSDILEVASRLQKGGLGYLEDNTDIEDEVRASVWLYDVDRL